jgi:putative membrane protein
VAAARWVQDTAEGKELRTTMGWYHDDLGWGGWLLMTLLMVVFWALVIFAVAALFRGAGSSRLTPDQILDERFARGEIDAADYQARRDALHNGHRYKGPRDSHPPAGGA